MYWLRSITFHSVLAPTSTPTSRLFNGNSHDDHRIAFTSTAELPLQRFVPRKHRRRWPATVTSDGTTPLPQPTSLAWRDRLLLHRPFGRSPDHFRILMDQCDLSPRWRMAPATSLVGSGKLLLFISPSAAGQISSNRCMSIQACI